jgi:cyclopropane fatty-acyl-phospholipid synthase-like methyltransferase
MPTVEWNKSWAKNLEAFKRGEIKGESYGDQWGVPDQHPALKKVLEIHLLPFVKSDQIALEIGSGGGRWTQYLIGFKKLFCVELNESMFDSISDRFPGKKIEFVKTSGSDIPGVPDEIIDFVFSFGTLVHCDSPIIEGYLKSIYPLMYESGRAHLQFSDKRKPAAAANPDFADTTPESFTEMAERAGFKVEVMDDQTLAHSAIAQIVKR